MLKFVCSGVTWALAFNVALVFGDELSGRSLTFARDKGNCLACHVISGGTQMGDIGPALSAMRQRFPERQRLRDQIWDAEQFNDATLMPPFGRHEILSEPEIDAIVEFLYTL